MNPQEPRLPRSSTPSHIPSFFLPSASSSSLRSSVASRGIFTMSIHSHRSFMEPVVIGRKPSSTRSQPTPDLVYSCPRPLTFPFHNDAHFLPVAEIDTYRRHRQSPRSQSLQSIRNSVSTASTHPGDPSEKAGHQKSPRISKHERSCVSDQSPSALNSVQRSTAVRSQPSFLQPSLSGTTCTRNASSSLSNIDEASSPTTEKERPWQSIQGCMIKLLQSISTDQNAKEPSYRRRCLSGPAVSTRLGLGLISLKSPLPAVHASSTTPSESIASPALILPSTVASCSPSSPSSVVTPSLCTSLTSSLYDAPSLEPSMTCLPPPKSRNTDDQEPASSITSTLPSIPPDDRMIISQPPPDSMTLAESKEGPPSICNDSSFTNALSDDVCNDSARSSEMHVDRPSETSFSLLPKSAKRGKKLKSRAKDKEQEKEKEKGKSSRKAIVRLWKNIKKLVHGNNKTSRVGVVGEA
ncbi:uncharacterized protein BYT42DRAFT_609741 [Radiomyces spectabilis]|uniref:uncharacterized protein n=1 Tax=Radiomyces spectabilis TaxID=64574 RepID=UPI00221FF8C3|nr:uncharacterized protein BYT42DRAFT_609741 [Radiomyces spectabilis]KAI8393979.1 hypothetical protein BYT42DRAFT_609741 [Radiomyces spectabilis]